MMTWSLGLVVEGQQLDGDIAWCRTARASSSVSDANGEQEGPGSSSRDDSIGRATPR